MLIDGIWQRVKDIEQNDNTIVYIIAIKSFPKNHISDENITNDIDTKLVCTNQTGICYWW